MTMQRCQSCGSFVTTDFARVFGNNADEVFGCLDCMTYSEIQHGAARAAKAELVSGREARR